MSEKCDICGKSENQNDLYYGLHYGKGHAEKRPKYGFIHKNCQNSKSEFFLSFFVDSVNKFNL